MATITAIDTILKEAREAARAGQTPNEACRWPFMSEQGYRWVAAYEDERDRIQAEEGVSHG